MFLYMWGFISPFIIVLFLYLLLIFLKWYIRWMKRLPASQKLALLLIWLATRCITVKYCRMIQYEGRWYYSPMVKAFEIND